MSFTYQEIESQSNIWRSVLNHFFEVKSELAEALKPRQFSKIRVIGCGSTHYLSLSAAQLLTLYTDYDVQALPSSEAWLLPEKISSPETTLLLAISRSGTTTETIQAVERFHADGGQHTVVITCFPESPLAKLADILICAVDAQEQSVVQTRSFTSMYILSAGLAYILGNQPEMLTDLKSLPENLDALIHDYGHLPEIWADTSKFAKIFFLGSGANYGLACEAMLKVKEMSLSWVEAYHTLEFRHGPMSLVDDKTLVIGFTSETIYQPEIDVLRDLQKLGGTIVVCDSGQKEAIPWIPTYHIHSKNNERLSGVLYLTLMQRLGYHRALLNDQNPDQPKNLQQVIEI
jgi:glutamine---fructose-6-phosphate transaminase (isomerizing)